MADEADYEQDIEIDESALDLEWLDQPKRMLKYTKLLAEAKREAAFAKEKLDATTARMSLAVSQNPERFGLTKTTVDTIKAAVMDTHEVGVASNELIEARYEADVMEGVVKAFEQRKNSLENLVRLHGSQYFAGPSMPRDLRREREDRRERTSDANRKVVIRRRS